MCQALNRIFGPLVVVVGQGSAEGGAFLVDPLAAANSWCGTRLRLVFGTADIPAPVLLILYHPSPKERRRLVLIFLHGSSLSLTPLLPAIPTLAVHTRISLTTSTNSAAGLALAAAIPQPHRRAKCVDSHRPPSNTNRGCRESLTANPRSLCIFRRRVFASWQSPGKMFCIRVSLCRSCSW